MAQLTIRGVRLGFDDAGSGLPAFIFIHGWACDRSAWKPQFESLSADYRCISIDLRGRGESDAVPPFDATTAADDVAAIVDELGVAPVILVGHSLGGLVALLVNERHPEVVLGIVLGDSPLTPAQTGFKRAAGALRQAGSMSSMRPFLEGFFVGDTPPEVREHVLAMMMSCPSDVGAGMLDNSDVFVEHMPDLLRAADRKPFMAIWASKPLGDPAQLRDLTMFVRQEPIAGAGHFFQLEQPAITNALLRAFVDDVVRDPRVATP